MKLAAGKKPDLAENVLNDGRDVRRWKNSLCILEDLVEGGQGVSIKGENDRLTVNVNKTADNIALFPSW